MKNFSLKSISILFVLCAVLFTGCINPANISYTERQDGMGTVHVRIGNDTARTLLPTQLENFSGLYYILTFTRIGFDTKTETLGVLNNTTTVSVDLELGPWNMDVRGYVGNPGTEPDINKALVFFKDDIDVITNGLTMDVKLELNSSNMTQDGSGTLSIEITLPAGAEGRLEVYMVSGIIQDNDPVLEANLAAGKYEYDLEQLPSGFYNIYISVERNELGAYWRELAHIYDGAITFAKREFTQDEINLRLTGIIESFSISGITGSVDIDQTENNIFFNVPEGNPALTNLVPQIGHNGVIVRPAPSTGFNFSSPVEFTVLTANGEENKYTVHVVLKAALNEAIAFVNTYKEAILYIADSASDVPRGAHWVTSTEMGAIVDAIAAANLAFNNSRLTQTEIDTAASTLAAAFDTFSIAIETGTKAPDMDALDASIAAAIAAKAGVRQNSLAVNVAAGANWVYDAEMAAFDSVLNDAISRRDELEDSGTQTEVDSVLTALNAAITAFETAKTANGPGTGHGINGEITMNQWVIRITGLPSHLSKEAVTGIFKTDDDLTSVEMSNTTAFGRGIIANGEVTLPLVNGFANNAPWTGEGDYEWFFGLMIIEENTLWMLKEAWDFEVIHYPTLSFDSFRFMDVESSINISDFVLSSTENGQFDGDSFEQHLILNYGSENITMEELFSGFRRQDEDRYYDWDDLMDLLDGMGIKFGSDVDYTPFNRNDPVLPNTMIHSNNMFWLNPAFDTGIRRGHNITGRITGTISLNNIPDGAIIRIDPFVTPLGGGQRWNYQYLNGDRIFGIPRGTDNVQDIEWTFYLTQGNSLDLNSDWLIAFYLEVEHEGLRYYIPSGVKQYNFGGNSSFGVGALDPVDLDSVILTGIINTNAVNVSWLRIEALSSTGYNLGSGNYPLSGQSTNFVIPISKSHTSTGVVFRISGSTSANTNHWENRLFQITTDSFTINPGEGRLNIEIDLTFVTLSGSIDIRYNGEPLHYMSIDVSNPASGILTNAFMGQAIINPNEAISNWSIQLPLQSLERLVNLRITSFPPGYNGNWSNRDFNINYPSFPITLDQNRSIGNIDIGNVRDNTLRVFNLPDGEYTILIERHIGGGSYEWVFEIDDPVSGPVFNLTPGILNQNDNYRITITGDAETKTIVNIQAPKESGIIFATW